MVTEKITVGPCACGYIGKYIHEKSDPMMDNRYYAKPKHRMKCPKYGRTTAWHKHLYHAVVEWNG